jgi:hypothetical protein
MVTEFDEDILLFLVQVTDEGQVFVEPVPSPARQQFVQDGLCQPRRVHHRYLNNNVEKLDLNSTESFCFDEVLGFRILLQTNANMIFTCSCMTSLSMIGSGPTTKPRRRPADTILLKLSTLTTLPSTSNDRKLGIL